MATATATSRSLRTLVDGQPTSVEIESRRTDAGQRVEVSARGDRWVWIVDADHVARFETATAERRCPDWLDRVLRDLGALDVEEEG